MIIKTSANKLFLYGTIWDGDGTYFLDVFSRMDGVYPEIEVHFHCNGGSVFDGNLMYNAILNAKSFCDGFVDGIAASMGAVLLMAFRKVYMVENGYVMIHAPKGGTWGDAQQHENNAKLLRSIEKNFIKKLIARTGLAEAAVKKLLVGDNWFDAEQALEAKLIDGIIDPVTQVNIDDPAASLDRTFHSFAALMQSEGEPPAADRNDFNLTINMKQEVIAKLGLTGVTAQSSDTAVIEAIEAHILGKTSPIQASLDAANIKATNLETAFNTARDTQIKALLDAAVSQNKITAQQRETYESIGKTSGVEALSTVLSQIGARQPISGMVKGGGETSNGSGVTARDGWDWDKYQKEKPSELEALAANDPEAFNALYEAKFNKPFKS